MFREIAGKKEYEGGPKVEGMLLHAVETCGGLKEDTASIQRRILVTHFEERKFLSDTRRATNLRRRRYQCCPIHVTRHVHHLRG